MNTLNENLRASDNQYEHYLTKKKVVFAYTLQLKSTSKLETNTQADKMPAISLRLEVKKFYPRRSSEVLNNHQTDKMRIRETFVILSF